MAIWKRAAKWLLITAGSLVLLAGLLLVSAYLALRTDAGRNWAAQKLERLASTPGETEIRIHDLAGHLPFAPRVGRLELGDGQGSWLVVEDFGLELDPWALLSRTLDVAFLEARRIRLDRLPEAAESAEAEPGGPLPTRLPVDLRLHRLTVEEVSLGEAVLGEAATIRVDGDAVGEAGEKIAASLDIARSDGVAGEVSARGRFDLSDQTLELDLTVAEPAGGMIVRAAGLAELPALDVRLSGAGTLADWNGELALDLAGLARLAADFHLAAGSQTDFSLKGDVEGPETLTELPWRLLSGRTDFDLVGSWTAPATLRIAQARITGPALDLDLTGHFETDGGRLAAKAEVEVLDGALLDPLLPGTRLDGLTLAAEAAGTLDALDVDLRATASRVVAEGIEVRDISAEGRSRGSFEAPGVELRVTASVLSGRGVEARELSIDGRSSGSLEAPDVDLQATVSSLIAEGIEVRDLALDGRARGPMTGPDLTLAARIAELVGYGLSAGAIEAKALFEPDAGSEIAVPTGRFETSGQVARFALDDFAELQPAVGEKLDWTVDGRIDLGESAVEVASLALGSDALALSGQARLGLETGAADGALALTYPDLSRLAGLAGMALGGTASIDTEFATEGAAVPLKATVAAAFAELAIGEAIVQALLGPNTEIEAEVTAGRDGAVSLDALTLESPATRLTATLAATPSFEQLSSDYRVEIADLGVLGPALGQALAGSAELTGRAEGSLSDLGTSGDLALRNGDVAGQAIEALDLGFTALNLPARPNGRLDATARLSLGDMVLATLYLVEGEVLSLDEVSIAAEGSRLEGSASIPFSGDPLRLDLSGRAETLAPWLALGGLEGDGGGTLSLALAPRDGRQGAKLDAELENLAIGLGEGERLTLGGLEASLDSGDLFGGRLFDARLAARDLEVADLALASATAEANVGLSGGTVSLRAEGDWRGELRLDTAGEVALSGARTELRIDRLEGRVLEQDIALAQPARVAFEGSDFSLRDLDVTYGPARLRASAGRSAAGLSADLAAEGIALALLKPFVELPLQSGSADLTLKLAGTAANPDGDWTFELRDARLAELEDLPPLHLQLDGDWRNGRVKTAGRLSGLAEKDAVLELELPLRMDPETLVPYLPPNAGVDGRLSWQGPVGPLWSLAALTRHELSGLGSIEVAIDGPVDQPRLAGEVTLEQGSYESLDAGTLLKQLALKAELDGDKVRLTRLTAGDGGTGSITGGGGVEVAADKGFPAELEVAFKSFALLRRDEITAISDGKVSVTTNKGGARLEGRLHTELIEIRIPDRLPPDVVDLGVVELDAGPDSGASDSAAEDAGGFELALDVTIDIPRRAFIRGRGLDSEWSGGLEISGTADAPLVKGGMNLVRGQITALGRTLKLDKGSVRFLGGETIDPILDIAASRESDEYLLTVSVKGPVSGPDLTFTSDPALPEDEVISRVLFNKSTTQLSAAEAAQLAASVAELSGKGGGLGNMVNNIRTTLGVDVLRLEASDDDESSVPSVAAGKYLTEDVYVGAKQGATAGSSAAEVEIELTPNIIVESEVGETGDSEVGVKFKWDY